VSPAQGTGVESSSLSRSQNDGDRRASSVTACTSSGASARSRLLKPDWPGMYGNRCPSRRLARRKNRRSFGQSSNTCATARQTSSLSLIRGGRPNRRLTGRRSSTST
jgi:hypothetical protein